MSKKFYEQEVKDAVLKERHLFYEDEITSDQEDIRIYNEKAIAQGKCIMDCFVLDRNGTTLGIEIKTEMDSTQRLNKQLFYYSQVCKYVYVMCHDKHLPKVEKIIKDHKHTHVGILSYIDFKGELLVGKYKRATPSPHRTPYHCLNILWKMILVTMLRYIRDPFTFRSGYNFNAGGDKSGGSGHFNNLAFSKKRNTKPQIINGIISYIGRENSYKLFTRCVIYGYTNRWKIVEEDFFKALDTEMGGIIEKRETK